MTGYESPASNSTQPSRAGPTLGPYGTSNTSAQPAEETQFAPPAINLPKGGGAIRGIGEKFSANPVTGTGSMSVPIATSPGRSGFGPQLSLSYDSGSGNGPFGFGWTLSLPAITRKTDKGLPEYRDADESDVYVLSGAEDLVPVLGADGKRFEDSTTVPGYLIHRYRPRIEGLFARIERWTHRATGEIHWRSITRDNVATLYGQTNNSRVLDPSDPASAHPTRIFTWLICETYDDKGNAIVYEYAAEDDASVDLSQANERNRLRTANRYLKRIKYGNRTSRLIQPDLTQMEWMFEVVFDYDEGHYERLAPDPARLAADQHRFVRASVDSGHPWAVRPDPFSSHQSGFEVRTYRRCHRVLMFHRFPELGDEPCLVRSTEFDYTDLDYSQPVTIEAELAHQGSTRFASFIRSVTQSGFVRDAATQAVLERNGVNYITYLAKSLPPLEFEYSKASIGEEIHELDAESLENLPIGLDGASYQFVDLDGEGVSGILTEQADAWFYKPNLGEGHFGPLQTVAAKPSLAALTSGRQQLLDLAGDGQLDLVALAGPTPGFYERTQDEDWEPFQAFRSLPTVSWDDPNLRFVDLDGDGHADILITEQDVFTWYPSLAEEGFAPARRVHQSWDEERGPRLLLADGTQSIYLADMCGDGLTDLVRIRNGGVSYWPNLGYGRFGAKVAMDNAPWFDNSDQFDQRRVRLADIDGSGTTDILYLHSDGLRLYFNQSGNRLSEARRLGYFPPVDNLSSVITADLLGNGTACLVWSSPLPANARRPLRYINLMGGRKPHLLIKSINNLGAETHVQYAPSTRFYLADKLAGRPWSTKIPFPVHVVEYVEAADNVSRTRLVTRYAYHHGYFDGVEREFRGFGMVEQSDTEAFEDYVASVASLHGDQDVAPENYQPPVTTRTWYHTGAPPLAETALHQLRHEYHRTEQQLLEPGLPPSRDPHEARECLRALKGLPLRQETWSFDGSAQEQQPYTVVEYAYELQVLQPRGEQRHAVFLPVRKESLSINYERDPSDPRIAHSLALETDEYGNALKSCSIVYGRKIVDADLPTDVVRYQQHPYITYSEADYTPDIDRLDPILAYRLRVPFELRNYEVTGIAPASGLFRLEETRSQIATTVDIPYEAVADGVAAQRRLLSMSRYLFLDDNLNPLPLGQWDSCGLGYRHHLLAFTPHLIDDSYAGQVSETDLKAAGYVHFDGDENWWIPSGTAIYPANPQSHFYIPMGATDPLGVETVATFDRYDLLVERTQVRQGPWNEVAAVNDYRVLRSVLITDPNKNRTAVKIDALGMVTESAVMGKETSGEGDTLGDPTVRMEYELFNWMSRQKPNFVHTLARERHRAANPRWQESYAYSSGTGAIVMVKAQAHPGTALVAKPDGTVSEVDADPRWVGNGRKVLNNKGKPVMQYEPYFSTTSDYEDARALREIGVTSHLYYDAVGRNVLTRFPNGTSAKVEFDPWKHKVFDANDTVTESQWYTDRGSPVAATQPEPLNDPERRAAWLSSRHANTPGVIYLDSLGRPVYALSDYGGGRTAAIRSECDLTGRFSKLFDQRGRQVANGLVGPAGTPISGESAERGRRWMFHNVLGDLVRIWDEHGRQLRAEYDELHRLVATFFRESGRGEVLYRYVVYGDRHPSAEDLNLLGFVHEIFDQAGMMRVPEMDFKGNPKRVERALAKDYRSDLDWKVLAAEPDYDAIQTAATPLLGIDELFAARWEGDALNRPTQVTLPDQTVIVPIYNEGNFLTSLQVQLQGRGGFVDLLRGQDYDAKGQRQCVHYGNDVVTRYFYDAKTFRLSNLLTYDSADGSEAESLQNLHFTYDPVGNIVQIRDDAHQPHFFRNAVVRPENRYEYDALYQLVRATGREHAGLGNGAPPPHRDIDIVPQLPHPNDSGAVRTYSEEYDYDLLGNLKVLRHRVGAGNGWTRHYRYAYEDDPANRTNRLIATSLPGDPDNGPYAATYDYDAYGNVIRMPHLSKLDWNSMDQLRRVDLGGGGAAYNVYDSGGQRIRKVVERQGGTRTDRIYLGPLEVYRERKNSEFPHLERLTISIVDNVGLIAQIDTKTRDERNTDPANPLNVPLIRYQHRNHIGSATVETDADGHPISYEEYTPYGVSTYRSAKPGPGLSLKRYRFSGKERDSETGLYYFGARYYASWLGRWTSTDPAGFQDGLNHFRFCRNNPVILHDRTGLNGTRIYELGPDFEQDIHTNSPDARARLEGALTGKLVTGENGLVYQINRPSLEWKGDKIGWFFNTKTSDISIAGEELSFEGDEITASSSEVPSTPPDTPPVPSAPPTRSSATPGETSQASEEEGGGGGRSFFTSSFFKGLVVGLAVTVAVVAIVATGGAALAVIAPAASSFIAASGVGTVLAVAGGALAVANVVQSVRQRDLRGNPISEEEANFNLGLGIGSFAGGAFARPVAGAGAAFGQSLGRGVVGAGEAIQNLAAGGGQLALAGGGTFGNAIAAPSAAGVTTTSAVTAAGTAMGTNVLMAAGDRGTGGGGPPLPRLDGTGKVHGELPDHVPDNWTRADLEELADDLQQSIRTRQNEQIQLGEHGPHRARLGQEERLLQQILKRLSGS